MAEVVKNDKKRVIEILANAFDDNKSVNYIVKQDKGRSLRIRWLMEYAYWICKTYGKVTLSNDGNACALVLLPHTKRTTLKGICWDLKLAFCVIGLNKILKVLKRENLIKKQHPLVPFYYLWFIGVDPLQTHAGIGSMLLQKLIADAESMGLPFYLETSTSENISWYQKFGLHIYDELDLGYKLYFFKN